MHQPPTPSLARRSVLTLAMTGALGALTACSGDSKKPSATGATPAGSSTAGSGVKGPKITPVAGFKDTASWASTSTPELAALTPMPDAGAAWFDDHAWFVMSNEGEGSPRICAFDPATQKIALSQPIKPLTGDGVGWVTVTSPEPALILDRGGLHGDTCIVKLTGTTVTTTTLAAPVDGTNPQWMGDVIAAPSLYDPNNNAAPGAGYYLNTADNTYAPLKPQHGGSIIGAVPSGANVQPVEVASSSAGPRVYAADASFTSGISRDGGGDRPISQMLWTHDGALVLLVQGPTNGAVSAVAYSTDGKANKAGMCPSDANPDQIDLTSHAPNPQAVSADRNHAILNNGLLYDATTNTLTPGVYMNDTGTNWDLGNVAVTPTRVYANASIHPNAEGLPTGAFVGASGILSPNADSNKTAPALVMPDGAGLFLNGGAAQILPKA